VPAFLIKAATKGRKVSFLCEYLQCATQPSKESVIPSSYERVQRNNEGIKEEYFEDKINYDITLLILRTGRHI
jgi:hypothetical protein